MRFAFDQDHLDIRDGVAAALADACPPARVRAAWGTPDTELRSTLAELGVLALNLPDAVGGLELGALGWVLPLESAGERAAPVALLETIASNPTLIELGMDDLASRVATGEAFVTVANAGGYAVDADRAALILRTHQGRVEIAREPRLTAQASVDGARRLFRVQATWEPTDASAAGLQLRASLAAAAQLVGLSRTMLQLAVDYAKVRRQFGKPIGAFQAVQHHLVDGLLALQFAAPTVYRAAWELDHATPRAATTVRAAKLHTSEAASLVAAKSLQVHGAIGYTEEHDLHLWMKPAWVLAAAWGSPREQLATLSTHLLGSAHA